jgi:hypothetical protein
MKALFLSLALFGLATLPGCPTQSHGDRCNPLRATSDCDDGLTCVYPTGPMCGVSYCCAVDKDGNVADPHPNCQPDPDSAAQCGLDLSTPAPLADLSSKD